MKKRFSRIVETFQVEMPLEMYQVIEDSINFHNGDRILTGSDLIDIIEQNDVDYDDPNHFFYCREDKSIFDLRQMESFCLEAQQDVDYEFEVSWRSKEYFTQIIRDRKLQELL